MRIPTVHLASPINTGNAMPYEKPTPTNQRPLAPTLSASGMRAMNTTPLTPRVAGSTPLITATLPKRGVLASPLRDDNPLDSNITPRSGSRKTRVDSSNNTPTGTPTPTLQADPPRLYSASSPYTGGGSTVGGSPYLKPAIAIASPQSEVGGNKASSQNSSKFFHASDAKPSTPQPGRLPRPQAQRAAGYLNARPAASQVGSKFGSSSSLSSMAAEDKGKAKFFHANGTPDLAPVSLPGYHSRPGSTISSMSHTTAPRLAAQSTTPRSASPTKSEFPGYSAPRPQAGKRVPSSSISQNIYSPPLSAADSASSNIKNVRKTSGHYKSPSLNQINHKSDHRASIGSYIGSEGSTGTDATTSTTRRDSAGQSLTSTEPEVESSYFSASDVASISQPSTLPPPISTSQPPSIPLPTSGTSSTTAPLMSPVKAGNSIERMNELAAAARTERKVMDLEITNSSLAAINRTLEREMRKQREELRRFRRLSRSGRLSIMPSKARSSLPGVEEEDSDDLDEESSSEDLDSADDSDDASEEDKSAEALAESDARHSKRDEKLLQLDLRKHQQLLEDSVRMNASLKKCLGWTEELIREGKRALDFKVGVGDVVLGGRVLVVDEGEEEEHEEHEESGEVGESGEATGEAHEEGDSVLESADSSLFFEEPMEMEGDGEMPRPGAEYSARV